MDSTDSRRLDSLLKKREILAELEGDAFKAWQREQEAITSDQAGTSGLVSQLVSPALAGISGIPESLGGLLRMVPGGLSDSVGSAISRYFGDAATGFRMTGDANQAQDLADITRSFKTQGFLPGMLSAAEVVSRGTAENAAQLALSAGAAEGLQALGMGMKLATALAPAAVTFPQETGSAFNEYVDRGVPRWKATLVAPVVGAVNAGLESLSDTPLLRRLTGEGGLPTLAKTLTRGLRQGAAESGVEALQEGTTLAGGDLAAGQASSPIAYLNRMGTAGLMGFGGGAGTSMVIDGRATLAKRLNHPLAYLNEALDKVAPDGVVIVDANSPEEHRKLLGIEVLPNGNIRLGRGPVREGVVGTVGGRRRLLVNAYAFSSPERLLDAIGEETNHITIEAALQTPEGRRMWNEFFGEHPLTAKDVEELAAQGYVSQKGETFDAYMERLADELVAKTGRKDSASGIARLLDPLQGLAAAVGLPVTRRAAARLLVEKLQSVVPESAAPAPNLATPPRLSASMPGTPLDATKFSLQFPDSKVVDPEGKPLVVYHGTDKDFSTFDPSLSGDLGIHFGTAEQASKAVNVLGKPLVEGARVIPAFLDIKNPLRLPDVFSVIGKRWTTRAKNLRLDSKGIKFDAEQTRELHDAAANLDRIRDRAGGDWKLGLSSKPEVREAYRKEEKRFWKVVESAIKASGYDGVVYSNKVEGKGDSYIVFSPDQIKPALTRGGEIDGSQEKGNVQEEEEGLLKQPDKGGVVAQATPSDVERAARAAGYTVGPVWHGGSFDPSQDEATLNPWTHFGTKNAAEERVGGSGVADSYLADLNVYRTDSGKWAYDISGFESETEYDSEAKARAAGEREALQMAENAEPPEANFVPAYIRGPFIRMPDPGTWGIGDVMANLPDPYKLTPEEKSAVWDLARSGRVGDDWEKLTGLLEAKGARGIVYQNAVEDKGKDSYIVFRPESAKSAAPETVDPITGRVIPLAQRFEPNQKDFRYSLSELRESWRTARLVTPNEARAILGETRPGYLEAVARFILDQRKKTIAGQLKPRDVVKAYVMTLASQRAGVAKLSSLRQKGYDIPERFTVENGTRVRPEEATGWWFGTPEGQAALDAADRGDFSRHLWEPLLTLRDAYGLNVVRNNAFRQASNKLTIRGIKEVTDRINAAKGDLVEISDAAASLAGIAEGKTGFILHLLGFGEVATVDAVEINFWITGHAFTTHLEPSRRLWLAREVKDNQSKLDLTRIQRQLQKVAKLYDLPPAVGAHIIHHWLWDRVRGSETTHEGMMEAQSRYSFAPQKLPDNVGHASVTGKVYEPTIFRLPALDDTDGAEDPQRRAARRNFEDATDVLRAVHQAGSTLGAAHPEDKTDEARLGRWLKPLEAQALRSFAESRNLWLDPKGFLDEWTRQGKVGGFEHAVILLEDGTVLKANIGARVHQTWAEYFNRLAVHGAFFPETAYDLVGFSEMRISDDGYVSDDLGNPEGDLQLVVFVRQAAIESDNPPTNREVIDHMMARGWTPNYPRVPDRSAGGWDSVSPGYQISPTSYTHSETGVKVWDVTPRNVLKTREGNLAVVDVIFETPTSGVKEIGVERFSLAPNPDDRRKQFDGYVQAVRKEFPSAPEIVLYTSPPPDADGNPIDDPHPAIGYDEGRMIVDLEQITDLREVFGGLLASPKAQAMLGPYEYRRLWLAEDQRTLRSMARRLGVEAEAFGTDAEAAEPARQRVILGLLATQGPPSRWRRLMSAARYPLDWIREIQAFARFLPKKKVKVLDEEVRNILEAFRIPEPTSPDVVPSTPQQEFADLHIGYEPLREPLMRLRSLASELQERALNNTLFRQLERRLQNLADQARARVIGSERVTNTRYRISSPDFIEDIRESGGLGPGGRPGVVVTPADEEAHATYLRELRVRQAINRLDRLEQLQATKRNLLANPLLTGKLPADVLDNLDRAIRVQERALADQEVDEVNEARARRLAISRLPVAEAAVRALAHPFLQHVADVLDRTTGLRPNRHDRRTELGRAQDSVAERLAREFQAFNDEMQYSAEDDRLVKELGDMRKQIQDYQADQARLEVAVRDLWAAFRGQLGGSGTLSSRAAAEALVGFDQAVLTFIRRLASAAPDTEVGELRDALLTGRPVPLPGSPPTSLGVSADIAQAIVANLNAAPEFRNAVVRVYDHFSNSFLTSTLVEIETIEALIAGGDRRGARRILRQAVERRSEQSDSLVPEIRELEGMLREGLVQMETRDLLRSLAGEVEGLRAYSGTRLMMFRDQSGEVLEGFVRADGTPQPRVRVDPNRPYTVDLIRQLREWIAQAEAAVAAGSPGNDLPTHRGLEVALRPAYGLVDEGSTAENLATTIGSPVWASRIFNGLVKIPRYVGQAIPGIFGRRQGAAGYALERTQLRVEGLAIRYAARERELRRRAAKSWGLDPYHDSARLNELLNEAAHELRQFGSRVSPGFILQRSRRRADVRVTQEVIVYLRFLRSVYREAQDMVDAAIDYGGIRETAVVGSEIRHYVRPPASTGDIGFSREIDPTLVRQLASYYQSNPAVDDPEVLAYWERNITSVLSHILDVDRNDLYHTVDPAMKRAESALAREARGPGIAANSLDDIIDGIARHLPPGIPDPRGFARTRLLEELAAYGRLAVAEMATSEGDPRRSAGSYLGRRDFTEYSSPAAPLRYPMTFYAYAPGAGEGLQSGLERTLRPLQVAYTDAIQKSSAWIDQQMTALDEVMTFKRSIGDLAGLVLNVTGRRVDDQSPALDQAEAARLTRARLAQVWGLNSQLERAINQPQSSPSVVTRMVRLLVPFMLGKLSTAAANFVGGPVSILRLARIIGPLQAAGLATATVAANIGAIGPEAARKLAGIRMFRNEEERLGFLAIFGMASSVAQRETVDFLNDTLTLPERMVEPISRFMSEKVSPVLGVKMGDTLLNRNLARFVIPTVLRRLRKVAIQWRTETDGQSLLQGDATKAGIRQWLLDLGLNPEEVMGELADGTIEMQRFWRSRSGAIMGTALLTELNVGTRLNRPAPNLLTTLLGWAADNTAGMLEAMRVVRDDSRTRRFARQGAILSIGIALLPVFYHLQDMARQGVGEAFRLLAELLRQIPDDDEDENSWLAWLDWVADRVASGISSTSRPKIRLWSGQYWTRGWETLGDLVVQTSGGLGLESLVSTEGAVRVPGLGIVANALKGMIRIGAGAVQADADLAKQGVRDMAGLFGAVGRGVHDLIWPEVNASREAANALQEVLIDQGIALSKKPYIADVRSLFISPVQQPLLIAGRRLAEGKDVPEATAEIQAVATKVYQRAYDQAIENGAEEEAAVKAGTSAVKRLISPLNPYERAAGRALTADQYARAQAAASQLPESDRANIALDEQAAQAVAQVLSRRPPSPMQPFEVTPGMLSPVKQEGDGGGGAPTRSPVSRRRRLGTRGARIASPRFATGKLRRPRTKRLALGFRRPRKIRLARV